MTAGVLDALESASPISKSVWLCLDGAVQAQWDECLERLSDIKEGKVPDKGSLALSDLKAAVDHMEGLRDRYNSSGRFFRFERVPWEKRIALQAEHPPRDGNVLDRVRGFNVETYFPALIRKSCVEVTDRDGKAAKVPARLWDKLLGTTKAPGTLNIKQFTMLADAAQFVNEGENSVPPSARSLLESQDFGASLELPSPGTPLPSGSKGGSRRGSRKSSTTKKAPPSPESPDAT